MANSLVIAEIVWTLESFYHLTPVQVQDKILAILNTPGLEVVDGDLILQAIFWHVEKSVDFIDAYNAAWVLAQGLQKVLTYDRKHSARFENLTVLAPDEVVSLSE